MKLEGPLPQFITFTGADDHTSIDAMLALAKDYPVEFGILYGKAVGPRFPSSAWIDELPTKGLSLARHYCGDRARDIVKNPLGLRGLSIVKFGRVQINLTAPPSTSQIEAIASVCTRLSTWPVFQWRDGTFPVDPRAHWLFDRSGGRGKLPEEWPKKPESKDDWYGYAGGISAGNVVEVLSSIDRPVNYWIDLETFARDAQDRFSLDICREVCRNVYGEPVVDEGKNP